MSEGEMPVEGYAENEKSPRWQSVKLGVVSRKRSENVDPHEVDLNRHVGLEHIRPNNPHPDWESVDGLSSTKRRFEPGDILFAKLRPNLEKSALPDFQGVTSTDIFPIVAEQGVNSMFLLYRLSSKQAFDHARRTSVGTRMPRTSWNLFGEYEFELPPPKEQRRIASVLYTVEQAIQRTEEIIDQAQRVKEGLLQDLLGPSQFGKSTLVKVEKLGEWGSGSTPSKKNGDYWGGSIPWLAPKDIFTQDNNRVRDTEEKLTVLGAEQTNLYPKGSIAVVVRSGVLDRMLPVAKIETEMAVNQDIKILVPDSASPDYLLYAFEAYSSQIRQRSRKQGTTWVDSIQMLPFMRFELPIPSSNQQKEIVDQIQPYDELLITEKEYLKQVKRFKEGLMQDLLSGEVRTHGKDIEIAEEVLAHG